MTDIDTLRQSPQDGLQPLALRAMFWRPDFLADSPWLEHIPVAFWLVEAQRPRVLDEPLDRALLRFLLTKSIRARGAVRPRRMGR